MEPVPMALLTTVSGRFAADVLAARLDDEGFDVQLRGGIGQSAFPVPGFADVQVYVPSDQVEEASYVLLVGEVDATLDEEPEERSRRVRRQIPVRYRVVAGMLLLGALASLAHAPEVIWRLAVASPTPATPRALSVAR
ncbi:MAG TPA: hypothetical protein VGO03_04330 [Acidimicrobiia bacterium]|jgi:hypothetical protein